MGGTLIRYRTYGEAKRMYRNDPTEAEKNSGVAREILDKFFFKFEEERRKTLPQLVETRLQSVLAGFLKDNGIEKTEKEIKRIVEKLFPYFTNGQPYPEAKHVLEELRAKRYRLGLVSNTFLPSDLHINDLKRFGLYDAFEATVFSSDLNWRKPGYMIYHHMVHTELKCRFEECLFVGDQVEKDVLAPKELGMQATLLRRDGPFLGKEDIIQIKNLEGIFQYLPKRA